MHSTSNHHPGVPLSWSAPNVAITLLLTLLFLVLLFLLVALTAQPVYAQNSVPPTARQAASMPQFAAKLAQQTASRVPHRYQPQASLKNPGDLHARSGRGWLPDDSVVYDNGPINGTTDAWSINFGFAVSNTFTVASGGANLTNMTFGAWLFPGDVLQNVEVLVGTSESSGNISDQLVSFTQSNCSGNQYGFNVCTESGNFTVVNLVGGTYWVTLENATVNTGDPVYWDENSGPSMASENSVGTIPSEAFTILGTTTTTTTTTCLSCNPPPPCFEPGQVAVIHDFTGVEGPPGALATDKAGNLYGTNPLSGAHGAGAVYRLSPRGDDWLFTPLYSFLGGYDGYLPQSFIIGPEGAPYGTSLGGLPSGGNGWGLVYRLRPPSHACSTAMCGWTNEVLYRFTGGVDGGLPTSIAFDQRGHLYGTTSYGGAHGAGVVFTLTPSNGGWTETVIYDFPSGFSGGTPSNLLVGSDGNLYGVAFGSVSNCGIYGINPCGVVFQLVHDPNAWTENVIYAFQGTAGDGGFPSNLEQDGFGNLYGTGIYYFDYWGIHLSSAIQFKLSKVNGNWVFTSSSRHTGQWYRDYYSSLVVTTAGNTSVAGTALLYDLSCGSNFGDCYYYADGANYINQQFNAQSLVLDEQRGRLYGVTPDCGAYGSGTVWKIGP